MSGDAFRPIRLRLITINPRQFCQQIYPVRRLPAVLTLRLPVGTYLHTSTHGVSVQHDEHRSWD